MFKTNMVKSGIGMTISMGGKRVIAYQFENETKRLRIDLSMKFSFHQLFIKFDLKLAFL